MTVQLKSPKRPAVRRRAAPVDAAGRARQAGEPKTAPTTPRPGRDSALWLLVVFLVALSLMVGAIAVLAVLDAWWVLVAVFVLDLIMTAVVLVSVARMAADGRATDVSPDRQRSSRQRA